MLEMLGLRTDDERVYLAMLTTPDRGVSELCRELDLPEAAVRESLDRLADFTLLRPSLTADGSYRPRGPLRWAWKHCWNARSTNWPCGGRNWP